MTKPTVYLDTSTISAYWYEGSDVALLARRFHTREWWAMERKHFRVCASEFVESELRAGKFSRQRDCLQMVRRLAYLAPTASFRQMLDAILARRIVPATKDIDAAHLAISTAHRMGYLLTWNYAHLANPAVQARLTALCTELGLDCPWLVSPESIPQVRFGQSLS